MKSLRRMIRFVEPYKKEAILAMLLLTGVAVTDLLPPRLTQTIIDQGVAQHDMSVILNTSLLMIGAATLGALLAVGNTILAARVSQNVSADLRSAIVHQVQTFSFGNLDRMQTGQLIVRTTSDVSQVQRMVLMSMRMFIRAPLWMIGSITMLALNTPDLALLVLALLPLVIGLIWLFAAKARPLFTIVQKKLDALNEVLQENLAGVRVVKAFVRVEYENVRFDEANRDLTEHTIKVIRLVAVLMPTMMFVLNLSVAGVVWFGGSAAIGGTLTVGQVMAAVNYIGRALFPMLMLAGMMGPLAAADASAERIWGVLDNTPEVQNRPGAQPLPQITGRVAFEKVSFSYDGQGHEPVLKGIDLVAEPGQKVAILGATGSGKSSLIHLIPRFYDVTGGRVTLDGVDVRDMPLDSLRAQVGMALQETVLFTGTVRDNIRYGRPEASDAEVIAAAKAAQAHDFIATLPDGYDTLVGQRGINFSGGQKQRIAIARALLVQPCVLILDDSTSAIDIHTEIEIEEALDELMAESTSFIIAQRVSTVLNADKIVVLDEGQVAATGTHTELLASSPIYREIYQSQLGNGVSNNG